MRRNRLSTYVVWIAAMGAATVAGSAQAAGELVTYFDRAWEHEPLFRAAHAERQANLISSDIARTALLPQLQLNSNRIDTDATQRTTVSVVQPIIDASRYATFREGRPREIIARATFEVREQELALRYFKAVSELVRVRENLALNQAKIDAFAQHARSSKRAFELGTGTVTDLRDAQVRLDQARAADIALRAQLSAAQRQFYAMTGAPAPVQAFSLVRQQPQIELAAPENHLNIALQSNPQLIASRQNEQIAELGITRARGAFLPTVSVTANRTYSDHFSDSYIGLQLSIPLQASTFLQVSGAHANAARAAYQTDDLEQRTRLEIQRLQELVEAGRAEIAMRLESIQSAELSVQANEKSFRGGVRSKLDVLNSIQVLYQVKQEHLDAVLALAENLLQLNLQLAYPVRSALHQVDQILFGQQRSLATAPKPCLPAPQPACEQELLSAN